MPKMFLIFQVEIFILRIDFAKRQVPSLELYEI